MSKKADTQTQKTIDSMWLCFGQKELSGLTPYQFSRMSGQSIEAAKLVEQEWDGPDVFK